MIKNKIVRRPIKVKFIDMWWGDGVPHYEMDRIYQILNKYYEVVLSDTPDYVIDGALRHDYLDARYENAIKIIRVGENYIPDFNFFDYAIGFDDISFGDRYLRMPLFAMYSEFRNLDGRECAQKVDADKLLNRGFCSYVVTNCEGDPIRTEIFHRLSKYKKVASGGKYLNNVGGCVKDKNSFCAKYKFNIAFENSVSPGYTTEKIMQPLSINVVPIYYGNPSIEADFRTECMVHVKSREDIERAVEEIIFLDRNDDAYLAKVSAPCLVHPVSWYGDQLENFILNIFEQPYESAKRTVKYGFQPVKRARERHVYAVDDMLKLPLRKLHNWTGVMRSKLCR